MRGEDFSAWLSAIGGMSAEQRRRGLQALMKADGGAGGTEEGAKAGKGGRREDALGIASVAGSVDHSPGVARKFAQEFAWPMLQHMLTRRRDRRTAREAFQEWPKPGRTNSTRVRASRPGRNHAQRG